MIQQKNKNALKHLQHWIDPDKPENDIGLNSANVMEELREFFKMARVRNDYAYALYLDDEYWMPLHPNGESWYTPPALLESISELLIEFGFLELNSEEPSLLDEENILDFCPCHMNDLNAHVANTLLRNGLEFRKGNKSKEELEQGYRYNPKEEEWGIYIDSIEDRKFHRLSHMVVAHNELPIQFNIHPCVTNTLAPAIEKPRLHTLTLYGYYTYVRDLIESAKNEYEHLKHLSPSQITQQRKTINKPLKISHYFIAWITDSYRGELYQFIPNGKPGYCLLLGDSVEVKFGSRTKVLEHGDILTFNAIHRMSVENVYPKQGRGDSIREGTLAIIAVSG